MVAENVDIYHKLKDEILTLKIKPGMSLTEESLASHFGVSRTPIRDVLKRLEYDKLIEIKAKSGTYVSKINLDGVSDIMYIRAKVEFAVYQEVMKVISPADLMKLRLLIKDQEDCLSIEDLDEKARVFYKIDNEFHYQLYSIVGKQEVLRLLNHSYPIYTRYRNLTYYRRVDDLYNLVKIHNDILTFIVDKNEEELQRVVTEHNFSGIVGIEKIVEEHPEYFVK